MGIDTKKIRVDHFSTSRFLPAELHILRLDLLHPVMSGNKWFKLSCYIEEAKRTTKKCIATFGGAFSNHIVATAAVAKEQGFKSIGIIRGERPLLFSPTLNDAMSFGMQLFFVARETYKTKKVPEEIFAACPAHDLYVIPEGGYGTKGALGAEAILTLIETSSYTHIITAVGTGTTLAGLVRGAAAHQQLIGISVLKNAFSLEDEIKALLLPETKNQFSLLHTYHFGGYARYTNELIRFMNELYLHHTIPTDFVYTGKAFYAAMDLMKTGYFNPTDKVLLLHTGGLQGNRSLSRGTLIF